MRILDITSPYWLDDPRVADGRAHSLMELACPARDASAILAAPCSCMPVPTARAYGADSKRLLGAFLLPFPYLPREVSARYVGETDASWQLRVVSALDAMGLVGADGDGMPEWGRLEGAPNSPEQAQACADRLDGAIDSDPVFDALAASLADTAAKVWPGGYPVDDEVYVWQNLAPICLVGSAALSAHRALAAAPVDPAGSVDLLKAMRQSFGPYFAPEEMTPVGVGAWYDKHVGDAAVMMDALVSLGLESQESADLVKEVANESRA